MDEVLRRVLVHRDLLEHDVSLGVDLGRVELRLEQHVGHDVERRLEVGVEDAGVDDRVLLGGGGVQLAAEAVEDLGDLHRRVARRALEQEVLDQVRDALLPAHLVARAGADPDADGDRAHRRDALGDDPLAAVQCCDRVSLHKRGIASCAIASATPKPSRGICPPAAHLEPGSRPAPRSSRSRRNLAEISVWISSPSASSTRRSSSAIGHDLARPGAKPDVDPLVGCAPARNVIERARARSRHPAAGSRCSRMLRENAAVTPPGSSYAARIRSGDFTRSTPSSSMSPARARRPGR